ncbi:MAG: hypothetical protein ACLP1Q_14840 [Solirubrobacteraceae bacterium]|jgi:hypothetical protein
MAYSPEYLARRRRAHVRRRRAIAASVVALVFVGAGAAVYLLNRSTHVVVLTETARVHNTPSNTASTQSEYPAAPGAPSLKAVKSALAATKHKHSSVATADPSSGSGSSTGGVLSVGAEASFQQLAASLPGHVELAVQPLGAGPRETLGGDEPAHGWSTTKVPVLVSLLKARGSAGLTSQEQSWAQSAITESNNESVLSLFGDLERLKGGLGGASEYMDSVLRAAGDSETTVATAPPPAGAVTTFGQTEWSPGEAVTFFRALANGCLLSSSQTSYVLGLMQNIESSESWGLGSAGFNSVAFKGGWGPEAGGYLVRQSGIVDPGSSSGAAVAIVNQAPDFGAGTETLTRVAGGRTR